MRDKDRGKVTKMEGRKKRRKEEEGRNNKLE